jgi:prepilin-type N-terminal cleavage/methylation domain-containing protein
MIKAVGMDRSLQPRPRTRCADLRAGFTLIEVVAVMLIIALVASLSVTMMTGTGRGGLKSAMEAMSSPSRATSPSTFSASTHCGLGARPSFVSLRTELRPGRY